MTSWETLQKSLGVGVDGIVGRNTLRALFSRMGATVTRAAELSLAANVHFRTYGILDNPFRLAHFMAQVAHESGNFKWMEEIASGAAYEGRKDLGNVAPGDGKLFKGRGPIQLTGRANYKRFGERLGFAFEEHPEMVAFPSVGLLVACEYWKDHGLNAKAGDDDILAVTKAINGGTNGLADRTAQLAKMKGLLGI